MNSTPRNPMQSIQPGTVEGQMHWLVIGPRKAATACGIRVVAHYPMSQTAMPANPIPNIRCVESPDYNGVSVTCPRCLAKVGRP